MLAARRWGRVTQRLKRTDRLRPFWRMVEEKDRARGDEHCMWDSIFASLPKIKLRERGEHHLPEPEEEHRCTALAAQLLDLHPKTVSSGFLWMSRSHGSEMTKCLAEVTVGKTGGHSRLLLWVGPNYDSLAEQFGLDVSVVRPCEAEGRGFSVQDSVLPPALGKGRRAPATCDPRIVFLFAESAHGRDLWLASLRGVPDGKPGRAVRWPCDSVDSASASSENSGGATSRSLLLTRQSASRRLIDDSKRVRTRSGRATNLSYDVMKKVIEVQKAVVSDSCDLLRFGGVDVLTRHCDHVLDELQRRHNASVSISRRFRYTSTPRQAGEKAEKTWRSGGVGGSQFSTLCC